MFGMRYKFIPSLNIITFLFYCFTKFRRNSSTVKCVQSKEKAFISGVSVSLFHFQKKTIQFCFDSNNKNRNATSWVNFCRFRNRIFTVMVCNEVWDAQKFALCYYITDNVVSSHPQFKFRFLVFDCYWNSICPVFTADLLPSRIFTFVSNWFHWKKNHVSCCWIFHAFI